MNTIPTINDIVTLTAKDKFLRSVILDAVMNLAKSKMIGKERDIAIFCDILSGRSLKDVAEAYNLTRERVRGIAHETLKRTLDAYNSQLQEIEQLKAERDQLKVENFILKDNIEKMKDVIVEEERIVEYPQGISWNLAKLLQTKVMDSNLSNRAKNCFGYYEWTDTVGGLMQYSETDILKFRNAGPKVRDEVREWLKSYGVDFGYTFKKASRKLSEKRIQEILLAHEHDND